MICGQDVMEQNLMVHHTLYSAQVKLFIHQKEKHS